jgi:hypothetical protein
MADAEGVIAEGKLQHALARARCRGTPLVHIQLLLGCAAINLKRLTRHAPEAISGAARSSAAAAAADSQADAAPPRYTPSGSAAIRLDDHSLSLVWSVSVCLN